MTDTTKPVTRRTVSLHPRHGRRIIVTVHGDSIGFRLDREKATRFLPIDRLYDQADLKHAQALAGFDAAPCSNPKKARNV